MASVASYLGELYRAAPSIASQQTAVSKSRSTPANATGLYQISPRTRRVIDPEGEVTIEEETSTGVWESAFKITKGVKEPGNHVDYDVDPTFGLLTRRRVITATSPLGHTFGANPLQADVRVTFRYLPLVRIGRASSFAVNMSRNVNDVTPVDNPDASMQKAASLLDLTATFDRFKVDQSSLAGTSPDLAFSGYAEAGTRILVSCTFYDQGTPSQPQNKTGYDLGRNPVPKVSIIRFFGLVDSDNFTYNTAEQQVESVSLTLDTSAGRHLNWVMN